MSKRIKDLSPEELAVHNERKRYRAQVRSLIGRVASNCREYGLRATELQLEFIKKNSKTLLPVKDLNHEETISCFERGIEKFKSEEK